LVKISSHSYQTHQNGL